MYSPQDLGDRRVRREIRSQHQRVHEQPDQVFDGKVVAHRNRDPDDNVLVSAVPRQQHLEGGEQGRCQRGPALPAQVTHAGRE